MDDIKLTMSKRNRNLDETDIDKFCGSSNI